MIKPQLLEIWKRQGLDPKQIIAKAKSLSLELPEQYNALDNLPSYQEIRSQRLRGSIKNYPMRSFRPSNKVDAILSHIKKGKISGFVNEAIEFFVKSKE